MNSHTDLLERREQELKKAILELQDELLETQKDLNYWNAVDGDLAPLKGLSHTRKNEYVHRAWAAIQQEYRRHPGTEQLHAQNLEAAVRGAVPGLKNTTFRSYLHKLKNIGVIEKRSSGLWALIAQPQK